MLQITSIDEILKEAGDIDSYLNITCSDEIEEIALRGSELAVYISRTGKMLADSKYHQDEATKNSVLIELGRAANIPPTILKRLIEASCKNENYAVNWCERLNRTATHQLEWCRTLISKAKEEMKLSNPYSQR
jgi:hypothetical protein